MMTPTKPIPIAAIMLDFPSILRCLFLGWHEWGSCGRRPSPRIVVGRELAPASIDSVPGDGENETPGLAVAVSG